MKTKQIGYKVVWNRLEYNPEWLEAQAKRMTDIAIRANQWDDSTTKLDWRLLVPLTLIGAVIGAVGGWFIIGMIVK